jgi:uncharacterized protein YegL
MAKQHCVHGDDDCARCALNEVEALPIHLHLILDVSPSMISRWDQTLSGLNEYMASIRKDQVDNDQMYKVSITTFSATVEKMFDEANLDSIPTFTTKNLQPHGYGTALYDAIGPTVKAIETIEPVLVVIITDGEENSSQKWDETRVSALMEEKQKQGNYTYAYLGVAKEAWGNAAKMGSTVAGSTRNMSAHDYTKGLYAGSADSLAAMTVNYSSCMRSASVTPGAALNVSNFFSQPAAVPTEDDEVVNSNSTV